MRNTRAMDYSRKNPSQTGDRGEETWNFQGIEEHGNSRGQLKKKWNFHRSVHKKVMWNDYAVI